MKITKAFLAASALAVSLLAFATSASAAVMQTIYAGKISNSHDLTNVFGRGSGSGVLDGASYTLTFTYDTSILGVLTSTSSSSTAAYGGDYPVPEFAGSTSPVISADLKINGVTKTIGTSNYYGMVKNYNDGSAAYTYRQVNDYFGDEVARTWTNNYAAIYLHDFGFGVPLDFSTPYIISNRGPGFGVFQLLTFDCGIDDYSIDAFGYLNTVTISNSRPSAVPLPAAFPLLAAGLGGLGLMARRRKRKQA